MQILLVHGLCRTPLSLLHLAFYLRRHGHASNFFAYVAAVESWQTIQSRLRAQLRRIARSHCEYAVIGHSLGGNLLAGALSYWPSYLPRPAHVITLGTPVEPPRLARTASRFAAFRMAAGEAGRRLSEERTYDPLRSLSSPWTAICGTAAFQSARWSAFGSEPNDGVLAASEARSPFARETREVQGLHTFLMNNKSARAHILITLKGGAANGVGNG